MKKLILLIAATVAALLAVPVQAITGNASVPVSVTLTPLCQITAPATVALTYTSFQGAAASNAQTGQVKCTGSRPYRIAFSSTDNTVLTATGTLVDINYTLTLSGTGAGANGTGSGVDQAFTVTGDAVAGQAGTCASGATCSGTANHTMYVIY